MLRENLQFQWALEVRSKTGYHLTKPGGWDEDTLA